MKQPLKDVSAETRALNGGSCGEQSFVQVPGELLEAANSGRSSRHFLKMTPNHLRGWKSLREAIRAIAVYQQGAATYAMIRDDRSTGVLRSIK